MIGETPPRALTLLTAVLLTLLGLLTGFHAAPVVAGQPEAPPVGHHARTTVHAHTAPHTTLHADAAPHAPPHAGDQCADACTAQAGVRHELHGERPAPPGHLAITPDTTAAPATTPARTPPSRAPDPASPGHPVPDRGRAPPAPSGT
ncbi:hypothetical protein [Streptomyces spiralis]|uniref:hypothetical protein n=1 Tax=Streptomyces spiralis TaxID=66376 RepID=UPI0033C33E45